MLDTNRYETMKDRDELKDMIRIVKHASSVWSKFWEDIEKGTLFTFDPYRNYFTDKRNQYLEEVHKIKSSIKSRIKRTLGKRKKYILLRKTEPNLMVVKLIEKEMQELEPDTHI